MKTAWVMIFGVGLSLLSTPALATGATESNASGNHGGNSGSSSSNSTSNGSGDGGTDFTDWGAVAGAAVSIIGTISEMAEEQELDNATRQPTQLSNEEKLKEIEALKDKFRREAEQEAKREVERKKWWTDEDTREVERGVALGLINHGAKVQLGSFIKEAFGRGAQETANLSDTAAEVMLNLKMGVNGAVSRVNNVNAGLRQDFNNWLDQLKNDIDKVD